MISSDTVTRDTKHEMSKGLVYVFTGEGKGKTSAALGVATRAVLMGEKVVWVSFYKQESWGLAEAKLRDKFANMEMVFAGAGFMIQDLRFKKGQVGVAPVGDKGHVVVDTASEEEHRAAAEEGLALARQKLAERPFLLVLDEVLNAVSEGVLESKGVIELLGKRGATHIVLTGRHDPAHADVVKILELADLVTECCKIKHPYDAGKLAVQGLDF